MGALSFIPIIGKVLDKVLPDKAANDAAKQNLAAMVTNGEIQEVLGQLEIDKTEAASQSTFVAGWRPAIGWVCAIALAVDFIVRPFFNWFILFYTVPHNMKPIEIPTLDITELMPLVMALLGLGAIHAWNDIQNKKNG